MAQRDSKAGSDEREWEADDLLEMVSHDLLNQQQAAMGFLELLEGSSGLTEGERTLVDRTVEALEEMARLFLQVRMSLVQREWGEYRPARVSLDRALAVSCRTVQAAFARDRVAVEPRGLGTNAEVAADGMLVDMLTQVMMALATPAPVDRRCRLVAEVEALGPSTTLRFSSEGFALNPMVTDTLAGGRAPPGRTRDAAAISLTGRMLARYGGSAAMEKAPPGGVGALLVIRLPTWMEDDAVDNDSR